ncbi:MAG: hypothetical protein KC425_23075, partial [Anaerolineales bacterium]|nr:hypothetical protein [Anaerolineales bacterium]
MTTNSPRPVNRWQLGTLLALTTLFGLQLLRTLLPLLLYVLRDRFGWSAIDIGLLALGLFLLTFLAAPLARWFGPRRLLATAVSLTALARLLIQLWTADPLADLLLALVGSLAFGLSLPLLVALFAAPDASPAAALPGLGPGLLGGLALDLGLHGLYGTYDLHWQPDVASALFVA